MRNLRNPRPRSQLAAFALPPGTKLLYCSFNKSPLKKEFVAASGGKEKGFSLLGAKRKDFLFYVIIIICPHNSTFQRHASDKQQGTVDKGGKVP